MLKTIMIAGIALVAGLPASAQEVRTADVHYGDLDLARGEGKAALGARVRAVLPQVCDEHDGGSLAGAIEIGQCRAAAMKDARAQIERAVARARARATVASR